jgi:hypothetical protein
MPLFDAYAPNLASSPESAAPGPQPTDFPAAGSVALSAGVLAILLLGCAAASRQPRRLLFEPIRVGLARLAVALLIPWTITWTVVWQRTSEGSYGDYDRVRVLLIAFGGPIIIVVAAALARWVWTGFRKPAD